MNPYFAYGSNLSQEDLNKYCDSKCRQRIYLKSKSPRIGIIKNYCLVFNYYSKRRGGGVANVKLVEPDKGEHVEGVLFDINDTDKKNY